MNKLTIQYEDGEGHVIEDFERDPINFSGAVMKAAAFDIIMGEAQEGELKLLFVDRVMGVVVYFDKEVNSIVTCLVEED